MSDAERLALISTVYGVMVRNTSTFHGRVGGDCAYLLGAIAEKIEPLQGKCKFSPRSRIVKILRDNFAPNHKVWSFVEFS